MFTHQLDLTKINPSELTTNQEIEITDILKDLIQKKNAEGLNLFVNQLKAHGFHQCHRTHFGIVSKRTVLQELFLKCNTYHNLYTESIKANVFLTYKKILKELIGNDAMEHFIYISGSIHLNPEIKKSKNENDTISENTKPSAPPEVPTKLVRPIPIRPAAILYQPAERTHEESLIPRDLFDSDEGEKIQSPAYT